MNTDVELRFVMFVAVELFKVGMGVGAWFGKEVLGWEGGFSSLMLLWLGMIIFNEHMNT